MRRKILIAALCLAAVVGAGLLFLLRPAGGELLASGHDAPADAVEARLAVAWSRAPLLTDSPWEGAQVAGVVPLCQPLPQPGSRASVFAATRDEGGDYLVVYDRGGALAGAVTWQPDLPLGYDSVGGMFNYNVGAAEQLLRADLGRSPDAIRYVATGNGFCGSTAASESANAGSSSTIRACGTAGRTAPACTRALPSSATCSTSRTITILRAVAVTIHGAGSRACRASGSS